MKSDHNEKIANSVDKSDGFIYKILRLVTVVYPGEALTALLLMLINSLLLTA